MALTMNWDVDDIIRRLLESGKIRTGPRARMPLSEAEITVLCQASRNIFLSQPMLLELQAPLKVCSDIHGQYHDLLDLFAAGGFPPDSNYLFLGDYVNRGKHSLESMCLLLAYKIKYPENFFLLRGNHECASITRVYGFYDECKRHFSIRIWKTFTNCFNCMPIAALVEGKIFCCHGGLSRDLKSFDQIHRISRPVDIPNQGIMCDLLWADPGHVIPGTNTPLKGFVDSDRGVSYIFGKDEVVKFLARHNLDLICRGHMVVEDGYEFFADRKLVTIFSMKNYCGEFDNAGALMSIDETLTCSFTVFKPDEKRIKRKISSVERKQSVSLPSRPIQMKK